MGGWVGVVFLTADSLRSVPQYVWSSTASSGNVNDWRTREHVVSRPVLKLEMCKIQGFLSVNLSGARDNPRCKFR